jgi:Ca2+/Na+ antiporter
MMRRVVFSSVRHENSFSRWILLIHIYIAIYIYIYIYVEYNNVSKRIISHTSNIHNNILVRLRWGSNEETKDGSFESTLKRNLCNTRECHN